ncbi:tRNA (N6-threonylcarbamoyladenosine(37)-N6)-methyltransferase TrmO [Bacillus luteolus]|uniref:tRNA (N6-threonylcarbamoyladenosine(37)-N6)-methyltransferase TrmO n=1 Tax=Litchfieldia luteola TaxID=682179 RepID=A0ABR9QD80_9BACI|nr:tRNA (N6-threonylcarbamoyladenosine(37)-N6)-methyltransferase TrmO [Cytobacillus luteolus]MBE4906458.1 tRNA (N6-threonylcarbamoyladenosine(37)-N6)-methyltransferase TrmO [Cytobacillus luteolus]
MMELKPIAFIKSPRKIPEDDHWGDINSIITLADNMPQESLQGIELFSHVEIIFYFHLVEAERIEYGARHPRNDESLPKMGIFAQRGKNRPNRLGVTTVKIIKREGNSLYVSGLDAIDGTPVVDIKPVMKEFLPRESVEQPTWVSEIMRNYW